MTITSYSSEIDWNNIAEHNLEYYSNVRDSTPAALGKPIENRFCVLLSHDFRTDRRTDIKGKWDAFKNNS